MCLAAGSRPVCLLQPRKERVNRRTKRSHKALFTKGDRIGFRLYQKRLLPGWASTWRYQSGLFWRVYLLTFNHWAAPRPVMIDHHSARSQSMIKTVFRGLWRQKTSASSRASEIITWSIKSRINNIDFWWEDFLKSTPLSSRVSSDHSTNTTGWILGDLVDLRSASQ